MRARIAVPASVLVFLALGASACSGDESPQYHDAALEQSVRSYGKALSAPDAPAAWRLMSKRCQSMTSLETVTSVATVTHDQWGAESVTTFHIDRLSGTRATVTYGYGKHKEQQRTGWVLEGGVWKYDCSQS
uniref:Lipoprotein n=1 Tax=Streptomyces sp. NBC_00003 TaxID=2903608 RepID=A0AAU2UXD6_9ACTN